MVTHIYLILMEVSIHIPSLNKRLFQRFLTKKREKLQDFDIFLIVKQSPGNEIQKRCLFFKDHITDIISLCNFLCNFATHSCNEMNQEFLCKHIKLIENLFHYNFSYYFFNKCFKIIVGIILNFCSK